MMESFRVAPCGLELCAGIGVGIAANFTAFLVGLIGLNASSAMRLFHGHGRATIILIGHHSSSMSHFSYLMIIINSYDELEIH